MGHVVESTRRVMAWSQDVSSQKEGISTVLNTARVVFFLLVGRPNNSGSTLLW